MPADFSENGPFQYFKKSRPKRKVREFEPDDMDTLGILEYLERLRGQRTGIKSTVLSGFGSNTINKLG